MEHYMIWIDPINYFILLFTFCCLTSALIKFHLKEKKRKLNSLQVLLKSPCCLRLNSVVVSSVVVATVAVGDAQERKGDGDFGEEEEAAMQVGSAYLSEPDQDGLFFYRSVIFPIKVYIILFLSVLRIRFFFFLITAPWPVLAFKLVGTVADANPNWGCRAEIWFGMNSWTKDLSLLC